MEIVALDDEILRVVPRDGFVALRAQRAGAGRQHFAQRLGAAGVG